MSLHPKGQGLHSLEQQKGIEGGNRCPGVPQKDSADVSDKGGGAGSIHKADSVVAGVGGGDGGVLARGFPVKFTAVHDDAAQSGAVTADEFGGGMDNNVRAMLNGANQIGCPERVVDDQRQAVSMGDFGNGVNVGDIAVGVAQGLQVNGFGVGLNGGCDCTQIVGVHESGRYTKLGQGVGQQIVAAAVDGFLGHDVLPRLGQGLDGVGDRRRAGSQCQSCHAALQGRETLLQHILGRVGQAAVDIPSIRQPKPGGGVGGVSEHVGSGLVNGNSPGVGGGVGLLLAYMEL